MMCLGMQCGELIENALVYKLAFNCIMLSHPVVTVYTRTTGMTNNTLIGRYCVIAMTVITFSLLVNEMLSLFCAHTHTYIHTHTYTHTHTHTHTKAYFFVD